MRKMTLITRILIIRIITFCGKIVAWLNKRITLVCNTEEKRTIKWHSSTF